MEFVDGSSLSRLVHECPMPVKQAARYIEIIARAVHYADQHNVVHRDIKPSNVVIDWEDKPRITDFRLAKWLDLESSVSASGHLIGTPPCMPPEQVENKHREVGPYSDIYSIGATLCITC